MAPIIQIKRGTRAQLDAAATAAALKVGEPYLITDENRLAFGLSTASYAETVGPTDTQTLSNKTLGVYYETSATLTTSAGALTIPLDGKIYQLTLGENVTSITTSPPSAPTIGSAVLYIKQDGAGGRTLAYPATWYWAKGVVAALASAANAMSRLTLYSDPFGNIHADVEARSLAT